MNLAYAEDVFYDYLEDPTAVDSTWREYFEKLDISHSSLARGSGFTSFSLFNPPAESQANETDLQYKVGMLIRNFRARGHIIADIDPLGFVRHEPPPELRPEYYGFSSADMGRIIESGTMAGLTLSEAFERLKTTYCRSIGASYMHISDTEARSWLQERMEGSQNRLDLSRNEQKRILSKLIDAVEFEEFIAKKYVGVKSFSLKGSESLIPLLDLAVQQAGDQGVQEIVIGMAHRGRLNVLANICGKPPRQIFREFDDADAREYTSRGDVKYHLGYSQDIVTDNGRHIHMSLCFNPSHLEFVSPVVMGRVRGKQDRMGDDRRQRGLGIAIHGDAAFIGEGVVQETLNLSELSGYQVGGMLHVILNNQVGFTTGPEQGRSTNYASDIARMLQSPIFLVNGEDPEAVAQVVSLAMEFRQTFQRDVVIDMYAYRHYGHNESDEPMFTQPLMYKEIKKRESVRNGYLERLQGEISQEEADVIAAHKRQYLEDELAAARAPNYQFSYQAYQGIWSGYKGGSDLDVPEVATAISAARAKQLLQQLSEVPEGFKVNSKIKRFLQARAAMAQGAQALDWSAAEALAFASLATDGYRVRMSGQDVERGTFSHRHAVLHDMDNDQRYMALAELSPEQGVVEIVNSSLSENAVLGFEYGYSLDWPDGITLWEAQFGDFVNTAQVIIDQFISSGEDKWRRLSGLVMLLPHGFEGGGPEHSSARLERFLQLCAEDNMQVVNFTTPANYFHALRRQVVRRWRKPMVVMSPKSLLRHPQVVSGIEEFSKGAFQKLILDDCDPDEVDRILLCSGKVYYDLREAQAEQGANSVIIRLEQLYPLPEQDIEETLARFKPELPVVWVQEEPKNMGAWFFLRLHYGDKIYGRDLKVASRPESASPATGSGSSHRLEQAQLVHTAFNL